MFRAAVFCLTAALVLTKSTSLGLKNETPLPRSVNVDKSPSVLEKLGQLVQIRFPRQTLNDSHHVESVFVDKASSVLNKETDTLNKEASVHVFDQENKKDSAVLFKEPSPINTSIGVPRQESLNVETGSSYSGNGGSSSINMSSGKDVQLSHSQLNQHEHDAQNGTLLTPSNDIHKEASVPTSVVQNGQNIVSNSDKKANRKHDNVDHNGHKHSHDHHHDQHQEHHHDQHQEHHHDQHQEHHHDQHQEHHHDQHQEHHHDQHQEHHHDQHQEHHHDQHQEHHHDKLEEHHHNQHKEHHHDRHQEHHHDQDREHHHDQLHEHHHDHHRDQHQEHHQDQLHEHHHEQHHNQSSDQKVHIDVADQKTRHVRQKHESEDHKSAGNDHHQDHNHDHHDHHHKSGQNLDQISQQADHKHGRNDHNHDHHHKQGKNSDQNLSTIEQPHSGHNHKANQDRKKKHNVNHQNSNQKSFGDETPSSKHERSSEQKNADSKKKNNNNGDSKSSRKKNSRKHKSRGDQSSSRADAHAISSETHAHPAETQAHPAETHAHPAETHVLPSEIPSDAHAHVENHGLASEKKLLLKREVRQSVDQRKIDQSEIDLEQIDEKNEEKHHSKREINQKPDETNVSVLSNWSKLKRSTMFLPIWYSYMKNAQKNAPVEKSSEIVPLITCHCISYLKDGQCVCAKPLNVSTLLVTDNIRNRIPRFVPVRRPAPVCRCITYLDGQCVCERPLKKTQVAEGRRKRRFTPFERNSPFTCTCIAYLEDGQCVCESPFKNANSPAERSEIWKNLRYGRDVSPYDENAHGVDAKDENAHGVDAKDENAHGVDAKDENAHGVDTEDENVHGVDAKDQNAHGVDAKDENAQGVSLNRVRRFAPVKPTPLPETCKCVAYFKDGRCICESPFKNAKTPEERRKMWEDLRRPRDIGTLEERRKMWEELRRHRIVGTPEERRRMWEDLRRHRVVGTPEERRKMWEDLRRPRDISVQDVPDTTSKHKVQDLDVRENAQSLEERQMWEVLRRPRDLGDQDVPDVTNEHEVQDLDVPEVSIDTSLERIRRFAPFDRSSPPRSCKCVAYLEDGQCVCESPFKNARTSEERRLIMHNLRHIRDVVSQSETAFTNEDSNVDQSVPSDVEEELVRTRRFAPLDRPYHLTCKCVGYLDGQCICESPFRNAKTPEERRQVWHNLRHGRDVLERDLEDHDAVSKEELRSRRFAPLDRSSPPRTCKCVAYFEDGECVCESPFKNAKTLEERRQIWQNLRFARDVDAVPAHLGVEQKVRHRRFAPFERTSPRTCTCVAYTENGDCVCESPFKNAKTLEERRQIWQNLRYSRAAVHYSRAAIDRDVANDENDFKQKIGTEIRSRRFAPFERSSPSRTCKCVAYFDDGECVCESPFKNAKNDEERRQIWQNLRYARNVDALLFNRVSRGLDTEPTIRYGATPSKPSRPSLPNNSAKKDSSRRNSSKDSKNNDRIVFQDAKKDAMKDAKKDDRIVFLQDKKVATSSFKSTDRPLRFPESQTNSRSPRSVDQVNITVDSTLFADAILKQYCTSTLPDFRSLIFNPNDIAFPYNVSKSNRFFAQTKVHLSSIFVYLVEVIYPMLSFFPNLDSSDPLDYLNQIDSVFCQDSPLYLYILLESKDLSDSFCHVLSHLLSDLVEVRLMYTQHSLITDLSEKNDLKKVDYICNRRPVLCDVLQRWLINIGWLVESETEYFFDPPPAKRFYFDNWCQSQSVKCRILKNFLEQRVINLHPLSHFANSPFCVQSCQCPCACSDSSKNVSTFSISCQITCGASLCDRLCLCDRKDISAFNSKALIQENNFEDNNIRARRSLDEASNNTSESSSAFYVAVLTSTPATNDYDASTSQNDSSKNTSCTSTPSSIDDEAPMMYPDSNVEFGFNSSELSSAQQQISSSIDIK